MQVFFVIILIYFQVVLKNQCFYKQIILLSGIFPGRKAAVSRETFPAGSRESKGKSGALDSALRTDGKCVPAGQGGNMGDVARQFRRY